MTQDEIGVLLNLRATLSEYEHFMTELSTMIERGVDVPPCGSAKFPMRDKLYAQVRDLVVGKSVMAKDTMGMPLPDKYKFQSAADPSFRCGDNVALVGDNTVHGIIRGFSEGGTMALVWIAQDGLSHPYGLDELVKL